MTTNNRHATELTSRKTISLKSATSEQKSDSPNFLEQLNSLRESRANRRKLNRAALRKEIVTACGLGVALMKDETMWQSFCLADWSGIRNPPELYERQKAVFFALKYMCGPGHEGQSDASFYFNAVDGLVREGYLGDDLKDAIERFGGLKKLSDERRARAKAPYVKAIATSTKADAISGATTINTGSSASKPPNRSQTEQPSKWSFDVEFPWYPRIFEDAGIPAVFIFEAQVTKFGEKCAMKVLRFQKVQKKKRR